jgi:hypothetical protein
MKKNKANKILGLIAVCINTLLVLNSLYWYYAYNFTNIMYLVMIPYRVLLVNALLGIIGVFMSVMLYKKTVSIKLFLIVTLTLWLVTLSNYFFPIY